MEPFIVLTIAALGICTPFAVLLVRKGVDRHIRKVVYRTSPKLKAILALNEKYSFKTPRTEWRYSYHCKSLNDFRKMDYLQLERLFLDAYYNQVLSSLKDLNENRVELEKYLAEYVEIFKSETVLPPEVKIKPEVYKSYENRIVSRYRKGAYTGLRIRMVYEYTSPAGRNHYESPAQIIEKKNVSEEDINDFVANSRSSEDKESLAQSNDVQTQFNRDKINGPESTLYQVEYEKKHDYYVTLRVEISVLHKLIYEFVFLNRYNGRKVDFHFFKKTASAALAQKVNCLMKVLGGLPYLEDPERIMASLSQVKEIATETNDFHLEMKEITFDMVKELDYKMNLSFSCNLDGYICIERIQIGSVGDVDSYLEDNPNSIFIETLDWVQKNVDEINANERHKVYALESRILSKSNNRCIFSFNDHVSVKVFVDIDTDKMKAVVDEHFFFLDQEIVSSLAEEMVLDNGVISLGKFFASEIRWINKSYSNPSKKSLSALNRLINKLIPLREQYKDRERIQFVYSELIQNSESWIRHFNLRPKADPIVLDSLEEGRLVCDEKLSSIMRGYQRYAFEWANKLITNSLSGILADDMGLGKTLEIISVLHADKTVLPNLIVCPASLIHNWEREFHKWCPGDKTVVMNEHISCHLLKTERSRINFIVSYNFLARHIEDLENCSFNYLILDEAQYIKNSSTGRSKNAKQLVANHRFALTGTPLENSKDDLVNIFDFVMPSLNSEYKLKFLSESTMREYISPFLLRRKKSDVLKELPEKNTIIVELDMDDEQKSMYDTYKITHANEKDQYLQILALLTKLRQICVCPQVVSPDSTIGSVKIDYMFKLIDSIIQSGESVLIYSFFASVFDFVEPLMEKRNIKYVRLDGSVSIDNRAEIIDQFDSDDEIHCFLISLKAGGVGLNLTKANNVIFLDPWWNIAVENQASDRTHRIGQEKQVTIYRLICKDTIEEKVLNIQKQKLDLINYFVESQGDDPLGSLTIEMMKDLLE